MDKAKLVFYQIHCWALILLSRCCSLTLTGRIVGAVSGDSCSHKDGGPSNVKVGLVTPSGDVVASVSTTSTGSYSFNNIIPGLITTPVSLHCNLVCKLSHIKRSLLDSDLHTWVSQLNMLNPILFCLTSSWILFYLSSCYACFLFLEFLNCCFIIWIVPSFKSNLLREKIYLWMLAEIFYFLFLLLDVLPNAFHVFSWIHHIFHQSWFFTTNVIFAAFVDTVSTWMQENIR